jgi:hypothetical protein
MEQLMELPLRALCVISQMSHLKELKMPLKSVKSASSVEDFFPACPG